MDRDASGRSTPRNDESALEARALYVDNVAAIHGFVARRIGRDDAADVVADVFRVAIENLSAFDPERGQIRPWLFGIAVNRLRLHWRSEQRRVRAIGRLDDGRIVADGFARAEDRIDARREADVLIDALNAMEESDRDLVTLIAWEGFSYEEAAQALDIPIGTVRSRLHRARRALRESMQSRSEAKEQSNRG